MGFCFVPVIRKFRKFTGSLTTSPTVEILEVCDVYMFLSSQRVIIKYEWVALKSSTQLEVFGLAK